MKCASEQEITEIRDEVKAVAIDGPAESCCRRWKPIEDVIKAVLDSEAFNKIYIRRDSITVRDI